MCGVNTGRRADGSAKAVQDWPPPADPQHGEESLPRSAEPSSQPTAGGRCERAQSPPQSHIWCGLGWFVMQPCCGIEDRSSRHQPGPQGTRSVSYSQGLLARGEGLGFRVPVVCSHWLTGCPGRHDVPNTSRPPCQWQCSSIWAAPTSDTIGAVGSNCTRKPGGTPLGKEGQGACPAHATLRMPMEGVVTMLHRTVSFVKRNGVQL